MVSERKNEGEKDDPSRAPESGDPKEASRSQGRIIDDQGEASDARVKDKPSDLDLESGWHGTK